MEDHDLLALEASVLFVMSDSGRVVCENSSDRSAAPRLSLAGCASLNIVRVRDDVDEKTSQAIESLAATEPALREPESTPVHIDEYVELLAAEAPVEDFGSGLIWTFPERLAYEHSATLVASDTAEGYRLLARLAEEGMPAALVAAGFCRHRRVLGALVRPARRRRDRLDRLRRAPRAGGGRDRRFHRAGVSRARLRGGGNGRLGAPAGASRADALLQHLPGEPLLTASDATPRPPLHGRQLPDHLTAVALRALMVRRPHGGAAIV